MPYREKKIYSGQMLEVEIYPVYPSGKRMPDGKEKKLSSEAQQNLNEKNARKKFVRLVNRNFTTDDIALTLTYRNRDIPNTEEDARKDFENYIRRIKAYRKKHGLPELKYICVLECKMSKGIPRWHFHVIMSGMDRDVAEKLWDKGDWTNSKRLQSNDFEFEALARYMMKSPCGVKRWTQSKNLKKPYIPKPRDNTITKRGAERMAKIHSDDREFFEKKYKGYNFLKCEPIYNEINCHWYISVVMRKRADAKVKPKNKRAKIQDIRRGIRYEM